MYAHKTDREFLRDMRRLAPTQETERLTRNARQERVAQEARVAVMVREVRAILTRLT